MQLLEALNASLDNESPTNHEFFFEHLSEHTGYTVYLEEGGTNDWVEAAVAEMKRQGATLPEIQAVMARYVEAHFNERL